MKGTSDQVPSVGQDASHALQTNTATGKRTYADAALTPPRTPKTSLLPTLQRSSRKKRRRLIDTPDSSLARRLWRRETGDFIPPPPTFFAKERFQGIKLQSTLDTYDMDELASKMPFLRQRSKVIEIVSTNDLIFSLTFNGVCAAFSRLHSRRICYLNVTDDEVIRSLFLNKTNDSLITVSVYNKDDFSSLHCRSTPLAHIRRGYLESGHGIFESESLRWPGFVEFDDVNSKILTFSAEDKKYKVWDLKSYQLLYTIVDERIQEIKISPGIMLLIFNRMEAYVPIRLLNVENGKLLREINHLLHRKRKVDFIEQFHDKLLVKQEHENLQIVDVRSGDRIQVDRSHYLSPNAFIFLYESEMFLTFQHRQVIVWNFGGQRVTDFEDHSLFRMDSNTSSIYITQQQDIIVSYCQGSGECRHGTINLSWIDSGKLLGKVSCGPNHRRDHLRALEDVTALFCNEESNEIYSGSQDGYIHVWSN